MKIRKNTAKIGRFYEKLKQFIEGDSLSYKVLFIFICIIIVIVATLCIFYIKYGGLDCMFNHLAELILIIFSLAAISPYIVVIIIGIFQFIMFLIKNIENLIVRSNN